MSVFLGKIVSLVEFGPASRLESIIERALLDQDLEGQKLQVLDIGSGGARYWRPILQRFGTKIELHLLDPAIPKIMDVLAGLGDVFHISGIAPDDLERLKSDRFTVVAAFDLIEHLSKEDGYRLLYEIDRICKGTSIIFTPNGHVWQPPSQNNPFNAHISGWKPHELRRNGWLKLRGHTGIKWLFGPYGVPKPASKKIHGLFSTTAILVRRFPSVAFSYSAIKRHSVFVEDRHAGVDLAN